MAAAGSTGAVSDHVGATSTDRNTITFDRYKCMGLSSVSRSSSPTRVDPIGGASDRRGRGDGSFVYQRYPVGSDSTTPAHPHNCLEVSGRAFTSTGLMILIPTLRSADIFYSGTREPSMAASVSGEELSMGFRRRQAHHQ
jgi:hypothetical protein